VRDLLGVFRPARLAARATFRGTTGEPIDDGIALFFVHRPRIQARMRSTEGTATVVLQMLLKRCLELGAPSLSLDSSPDELFLRQARSRAGEAWPTSSSGHRAAARCALRSFAANPLN